MIIDDTSIIVCDVVQSSVFFFQIIQRRFDGSVHFGGTWHDYKHGFGSANGEYWIGMHFIAE
jgi:hypothetical protein